MVLPPTPGQGVEPEMSQGLTEILANRMRVAPGLEHQTVVTADTVGIAEQEACGTETCAREVGKKYNVTEIVFGSVQRSGSSFLLTMTRLDVANGVVVASASRQTPPGGPELLADTIQQVVTHLYPAPGFHDPTAASRVEPARHPLPPDSVQQESTPVGMRILRGMGASMAIGGALTWLLCGMVVAGSTVALVLLQPLALATVLFNPDRYVQAQPYFLLGRVALYGTASFGSVGIALLPGVVAVGLLLVVLSFVL